MAKAKWFPSVFSFKNDKGQEVPHCVIVDNRWEKNKQVSFNTQTLEVFDKVNQAIKWHPLAIIPIGSRWTEKEAMEIAETIAGRMNVKHVEEELKDT